MENGIERDTTAGPELDYIAVKGFRSIASIERLELRPVNLVIGPNGSGKSNFIGGQGHVYKFDS